MFAVLGQPLVPRSVPGRPPPPQDRLALVPGLPNAQGRLRPLHRADGSPALGARHGDPDRCRDRWPPPTHGALRFAHRTRMPDRRPSESGGAGTTPRLRTSETLPIRPDVGRPRRFRESEPRATRGQDRQPDPQPQRVPTSEHLAVGVRADAKSSPGFGRTRAAPPANRILPQAAPASSHAAAPTERADSRGSPRLSVRAHLRRAEPAGQIPKAPASHDAPRPGLGAPASLRAGPPLRASRRRVRFCPPASDEQGIQARRADSRSSHCASSTTQSSGCSSAASDSRPRTANPISSGSGACPEVSPNATESAFR